MCRFFLSYVCMSSYVYVLLLLVVLFFLKENADNMVMSFVNGETTDGMTMPIFVASAIFLLLCIFFRF